MHRGPFFMGQAIGMTVNTMAGAWLIFAIVFFSFPYEMPVTGTWILSLKRVNSDSCNLAASNMNYTCVVVGGFLIIELVWWIIAGKQYSVTVQRAREEENHDAVIVGGKDHPSS